MSDWELQTTVVPDEHVTLARLLAETLAGPTGANMWTAAFSPTGGIPPTHWVTEGWLRRQFADLLPRTSYLTDPPTHRPGNAKVVVELAAQAGVIVTEQEVQTLFDNVDISDQRVGDALTRLGLLPIGAPE